MSGAVLWHVEVSVRLERTPGGHRSPQILSPALGSWSLPGEIAGAAPAQSLQVQLNGFLF